MPTNVNTFNGLSTAIIQWSNRNDNIFVSNVPLFISLAEQELFIKLSTIGNEQYVLGTFVPNNGIIAKPAIWGNTCRFTYFNEAGNLVNLERIGVSRIYQFNPNPTIASTDPRYYSDYGFDYWIVSPTPTSAFNYCIAYFMKQIPLSLEQQTNWNTINAYDLLLWSCMHKAMLFIEDDTRAQVFAALVEQGIKSYTSYDKDRLFDATDKADKE
jgi:hypothetical protein